MPMPSEPQFADVSVVIPAFRAARTIGRALSSVAAQTLPPIEVVVVVVDGSEDGTYEAAAAMAGRMNGIALKVFRQTPGGAGAARNRAVEEASGCYVAFLDAADEWLPEKLERSLAHLEGTDNLFVAHNYFRRGNDGCDRPVDCTVNFRKGRDPFVSLYRHGYLASSTLVARRQAVRAAGGFDPSLPAAQDFDLCLAMLATEPDARFEVFPETLSRCHVLPGSVFSHTWRRLRCVLTVAGRHYPALKIRPGSALASLWFRVTTVHYEAAVRYRAHSHMAGVLAAVLAFPFHLAGATVGALAAPAMWLWAVSVLSIYLFQFRHFIGPIRRALGMG